MSNKALIELLKKKNIIQSDVVEKVMLATDRKLYVPEEFISEAYKDTPLGIGHSQTISAPHMHAFALEILKDHTTKPAAAILDVGSGSGYLVACFSRMVDSKGQVYGIERIKEIFDWGKKNLQKEKLPIEPLLSHSNAWNPLPTTTPSFDAIHVGAAASSIPPTLLKILKNGGRMIIPIGEEYQNLVLVDKDMSGNVSQQSVMGVRYVPLVKDL